ncbi:hypothetical protein MRB53_042202 [Persea americana]|nr:hypothetical protein MRB53_042202 [Persea americana]
MSSIWNQIGSIYCIRSPRGGNKPGEANAPTTAINALASAGNLGAQKYLPAYSSIAVDSTPRSPSACYPATANIRLVLLPASQQPETISLNLQSQALFLPLQMEERSLQPPPIQFFDARNLCGTSTSYRKPDIRPNEGRYEPAS